MVEHTGEDGGLCLATQLLKAFNCRPGRYRRRVRTASLYMSEERIRALCILSRS